MQAEGRDRQLSTRAAALLAAGLLLAGNAHAASNVACDPAGRDLATTASTRLDVDGVEHVPPLASLDPGDSPAIAEMPAVGGRPLVELSPQAELILDRVFEDEADIEVSSEPRSPVAETGSGDAGARDAELDVNPAISSIRAEMFRKDI